MDAHPLAERYPLMTGDEYEAFKADIAANGCINPVWTFEGKILDGRNRYRACGELGVEPVYAEYDGTDPAGFVESQNEHRRHLTTEFRRQRVAEMRAKGMSNRAIAAAVGADETTVRRDLKTPAANAAPAESAAHQQAKPAPPVVTGRDGKQYPATRPKPAPAQAEPVAESTPQKAAVKSDAVRWATEAINSLSRIPTNDPRRDEAARMVMSFIKTNFKKG